MNLPLPFPDALQEFRVATSGLSAQNGFKSAAAVNAVTKSGTNRFSGNAFEFLRHHRFNATSPFAAIGPDGKRMDDGLKRQPVRRHAGRSDHRGTGCSSSARYQGTPVRQRPASNIAFVPTPAMLAGDFTPFTSPQCNGGRQVALRAPYVNNRIDPALFSPAALNLARRLPSDDRSVRPDYLRHSRPTRDEMQTLARIDYQTGTKHSFFGRYLRDPFHAGAWLRRRVRQHAQDLRQGRGHVVPLDDLRRDDGVQLVDGQRPAVRGQQGQGRRLPDAVLLAEATRRRTSTPTCRGT